MKALIWLLNLVESLKALPTFISRFLEHRSIHIIAVMQLYASLNTSEGGLIDMSIHVCIL